MLGCFFCFVNGEKQSQFNLSHNWFDWYVRYIYVLIEEENVSIKPTNICCEMIRSRRPRCDLIGQVDGWIKRWNITAQSPQSSLSLCLRPERGPRDGAAGQQHPEGPRPAVHQSPEAPALHVPLPWQRELHGGRRQHGDKGGSYGTLIQKRSHLFTREDSMQNQNQCTDADYCGWSKLSTGGTNHVKDAVRKMRRAKK